MKLLFPLFLLLETGFHVSGRRLASHKDPPGERMLFTKSGKCGKDETLEYVIACQQTITSSAMLHRNLFCPGLGNREAAITVDGPNAMLDCGGKAVIGDCVGSCVPTTSTYGIRLLNGATAVNCVVTKFVHGFFLDGDGNNQVTDSVASDNEDAGMFIVADSGTQLILRSHFLGNLVGINANADGTVEVKESMIAGNDIVGIWHNSAFMDVRDSKIFGNGHSPGNWPYDPPFAPAPAGVLNEDYAMHMENVNIFDNQHYGIFNEYAASPALTLRNVEMSFNEENNLVADDETVQIQDGVYACGAQTGDDIIEDAPDDINTSMAQPVCVNGTTGTNPFMECMEGCDAAGNASALVCV